MKYTVVRIDEDIDFGCEERAADAPVMAVVTICGEDGKELKLRQPDRMLYDRDINEGDAVIMNEKNELQKPHTYKAVIFDMDGTILDTSEDLTDAVNYAMEQCGHRHDFTGEQGCLFFGSGVKVALRRALAYEKGYSREQILTIGMPDGLHLNTDDEALAEKLQTYYMPYYSAHNAVKTGPFPGMCETLRRLKKAGLCLAVVSNKPDDSVAVLAEKYFPGLFELAIGDQSGIARKPAADMNMLALRKMGLTPEECIYVGDTEIDLETARNSHMNCIAVDWGFREAEALKKLGASIIIHRPEELAEILMK